MDSAEVDALQAQFGIAGVVEIVAGRGGLPLVRVTLPKATADIYLHGAQVTSWKPAGAEEVIFLSEQSLFENGKAIRGGVPICFPWFRAKSDDPKAPSHGLVRTRAWKLVKISKSDAAVEMVMALDSDESTRAWWPHEFRIEHHVSVGAQLRMELAVTNTGTSPMRFAEALHTYYRVSEADQVRVHGLDGVSYLDNMDGNKEKVQVGDVRFVGATDSAYMGTETSVTLIDPGLERRILLDKQGSSTTVVWNPWAENACKLADLGDEEWRSMACVEASNILSASVELAPGAVHRMAATLSVQSGA